MLKAAQRQSSDLGSHRRHQPSKAGWPETLKPKETSCFSEGSFNPLSGAVTDVRISGIGLEPPRPCIGELVNQDVGPEAFVEVASGSDNVGRIALF